jgi:hypothetical protein
LMLVAIFNLFLYLSSVCCRLGLICLRSQPNCRQREYLRSSGAFEAASCPRHRTENVGLHVNPA